MSSGLLGRLGGVDGRKFGLALALAISISTDPDLAAGIKFAFSAAELDRLRPGVPGGDIFGSYSHATSG